MFDDGTMENEEHTEIGVYHIPLTLGAFQYGNLDSPSLNIPQISLACLHETYPRASSMCWLETPSCSISLARISSGMSIWDIISALLSCSVSSQEIRLQLFSFPPPPPPVPV